MTLLRTIAAIAFALVPVAGCTDNFLPSAPASSSVLGNTNPGRGELGRTTYRAVDHLLAAAPGLAADTPLLVSSIVDTQDLGASTPFGNMVAEMVRSRLVQRGAKIAEPRLRTAMRLDPDQGEFMLARDRRAVVPPPNVAGIVTGTYAVGGEVVYVSLKLVSATDAQIISASDFVVPAYPDAEALLTRRREVRP